METNWKDSEREIWGQTRGQISKYVWDPVWFQVCNQVWEQAGEHLWEKAQ